MGNPKSGGIFSFSPIDFFLPFFRIGPYKISKANPPPPFSASHSLSFLAFLCEFHLLQLWKTDRVIQQKLAQQLHHSLFIFPNLDQCKGSQQW